MISEIVETVICERLRPLAPVEECEVLSSNRLPSSSMSESARSDEYDPDPDDDELMVIEGVRDEASGWENMKEGPEDFSIIWTGPWW